MNKIPDFIINYDNDLKRRVASVNNRIKKGEKITYNNLNVKQAEFLSFRNNTSTGTSEAFLITDENRKFNVGAQIFQL